ncbi:uncharacterized protein LOC123212983 [Mangifera indica]|uniref:uncharacterized protein LOC123212983 n=1 Tax=Mangifera indica TaxID=29780 RepID=UPI001CFA6A52|nr:uncharacterized protein LOC123212983 [Mangifera indica]
MSLFSLPNQSKMQVRLSTQENTNLSDQFAEDFAEKLKMNPTEQREEHPEPDEDEEEFSFVCVNPDSPISADEAFSNGQIRTMFPIFDQSLLYDYVNDDGEVKTSSSTSRRPPLKKLFVEEQSDPEAEPAGPFCEWRSSKTVKEASPDSCKKSNSTGFSKLWRFRDLVVRSSSDGKDAFVFLDSGKYSSEKGEKEKSSVSTTKDQKTSGTNKNEKVKKVKAEPLSSMYEKHYLKREGDRRKSSSPYRQDLVGFFTTVNGLSKNVHPY